MSINSDPAEGADAVHADSGDPNQDRAFLVETPPAQLDDEAVQNNLAPAGDEPGSDAAAARS